jgi:hypothetical protein
MFTCTAIALNSLVGHWLHVKVHNRGATQGAVLAPPSAKTGAAADRDLLSLSVKTRILQLRSRQINHRL